MRKDITATEKRKEKLMPSVQTIKSYGTKPNKLDSKTLKGIPVKAKVVIPQKIKLKGILLSQYELNDMVNKQDYRTVGGSKSRAVVMSGNSFEIECLPPDELPLVSCCQETF